MLTLVKPLNRKDAAMAIAIDQRMRAKLPVLPNPLVASWDERHRLVIDNEAPWIVGPLEIDPYLTKAGGYPFPPAVAAQLHRIASGGARFHRIAIAHEVEPNGAVVRLLSEAHGAGVPLSVKQVDACLGRAPAAEKAKSLAAALDKTFTKVMRTAAGGAAAVGAVLAAPILDPIVFGVVGLHGQPTPTQPAIYYPLAAWKW